MPVVPVTIDMQPTLRCNHRCSYCKSHGEGDMPKAAAQRIIAEAEAIGVEGIVWSGGGEPTLSDATGPTDTNIHQGLITNGGVPKPTAFWGAFDWVRFSVDSVSTDAYKAIRGVDIPECLADNISNAVSQTFVGIQMVVVEENRHHAQAVADFAADIGAKYLQVRPNEFDLSAWPPDPLPQRDDIRIIVRDDKANGGMPPVCHAANFILTVAPDLKCYVCACGGRPRHCVGDLSSQSLASVVYGFPRMDAIAAIDTTKCPSSCKGLNINRALCEAPEHAEFL